VAEEVKEDQTPMEEMQMEAPKRKGGALIWVILTIVISAIVFGGLGYWLGKNKNSSDDKGSVDLLTATVTGSVPTGQTVTPTPSTITSATITATSSAQLTSGEALAKVKALPEVVSYLAQNSKNVADYDHEDTTTNSWVIHVYYSGSDATATLNWYSVNKNTGEITKMF